MKWLTRRWHGWEGEPLTSEEEAVLETAYLAHVVAVLPRLPEPLKLFAGQPDERGHVSLHDGCVECWSLDGLRTLTLQVTAAMTGSATGGSSSSTGAKCSWSART